MVLGASIPPPISITPVNVVPGIGSVALDLDLTNGYQGVHRAEADLSPSSILIVDLVDVSGAGQGSLGFEGALVFDPNQIEPIELATSGVFPLPLPLNIQGRKVTITLAAFAAASGTPGSLAQILFRVVNETQEITVELIEASFGPGFASIGEDSRKVTWIAQTQQPQPPPALVSGPGEIALDLNLAVGYQGQQTLTTDLSPGRELTLDVAAVSGASGNVGFVLVLGFNPTVLAFNGFQTKDLWAAGFRVAPVAQNGLAEISVAILGGRTSKDSGSMGHATFQVLQSAPEVAVWIVSAKYDNSVPIGEDGFKVAWTAE